MLLTVVLFLVVGSVDCCVGFYLLRFVYFIILVCNNFCFLCWIVLFLLFFVCLLVVVMLLSCLIGVGVVICILHVCVTLFVSGWVIYVIVCCVLLRVVGLDCYVCCDDGLWCLDGVVIDDIVKVLCVNCWMVVYVGWLAF